MKKLSGLKYWDSKYQSQLGTEKVFVMKKPRFEPYWKFLLFKLCNKYLPKNEELKFVEIGCSPGYNGLKFHQIFGYQPFGVDYSPRGYELTKKVFTANGGNPNNVILADFLSDEFQVKYKNYFDIVASFGLIEHFDDSKEVVNKHINLLKRGGYLLITIPNKRGFFNFILSYIFNKEGIKIHNLKIMEKKEFEKLFDESKLTNLYCNYFGVFNFGLFNVKEKSLKRHLLFICICFQIILDFLFKILFKRKSIECRFFSPYLIYMGKKK